MTELAHTERRKEVLSETLNNTLQQLKLAPLMSVAHTSFNAGEYPNERRSQVSISVRASWRTDEKTKSVALARERARRKRSGKLQQRRSERGERRGTRTERPKSLFGRDGDTTASAAWRCGGVAPTPPACGAKSMDKARAVNPFMSLRVASSRSSPPR